MIMSSVMSFALSLTAGVVGLLFDCKVGHLHFCLQLLSQGRRIVIFFFLNCTCLYKQKTRIDNLLKIVTEILHFWSAAGPSFDSSGFETGEDLYFCASGTDHGVLARVCVRACVRVKEAYLFALLLDLGSVIRGSNLREEFSRFACYLLRPFVCTKSQHDSSIYSSIPKNGPCLRMFMREVISGHKIKNEFGKNNDLG